MQLYNYSVKIRKEDIYIRKRRYDMDSAASLGLAGILLLVVGIAAYFIPTIIAFKKERDNKVSILALNLLLGWSLIGWVVSLVWALKEA